MTTTALESRQSLHVRHQRTTHKPMPQRRVWTVCAPTFIRIRRRRFIIKRCWFGADSYGSDLLTKTQHDDLVTKLRDLQKSDGGWATATLADWERGDSGEQDVDASDAYGTAFVTFVLQRSGIPSDDPAVQKGILWLKRNQRKSGRWFSRSLYKDTTHFLSHAASAMAVMAIQNEQTR